MTETAARFEHSWFQLSPVPMLALDGQGRVRWANRALEQVLGLPVSQLLGHDYSSLPSPAHRVLFGDSGLVHMQGPGVRERWLQREVHEGEDDTGQPLRLHFYQDRTEELRLQQENRRLAEDLAAQRITDALTGLPNRRGISHTLDAQVSRSRRYGNPLSVLLVHVPDPQEQALLALTRHLRDRLRWVDQLARWDDGDFLVILPETGEQDAETLAEEIVRDGARIELPAPLQGRRLELRCAATAWTKGDDTRVLMRRLSDRLAGAPTALSG